MNGPILPVRMCVVVPLENGTHQPYCIACGWEPRPRPSKRAAETLARHHSCPRRGGETS